MQLSLLSVFVFLAVPLRVIACEGECIEGVTNKFCDLYEAPVKKTLDKIARNICGTLNLDSTNESRATMMEPVMKAYLNCSRPTLQNATFPSYFHGKCLDRNGNEPPGCPNPYCPIVCGTPGSLVYFYLTLLKITFDATCECLASALDPKSSSYRAVEKSVTAQMPMFEAEPGPQILRYRRSIIFDDEPSVSHIAQKKNDVKAILKSVLEKEKICMALQNSCGGKGRKSCSWEKETKEYILGFP